MNDKKERSPKTVDQVVERLIEELDDEMLIKIRDSKSLNEQHFGLGMYIRNEYIYTNENKEELLNDVFSRKDNAEDKRDFPKFYDRHPDDASHIIVEELQKRLKKTI